MTRIFRQRRSASRCPISPFAVPLQSFVVHFHGPKPHDHLRYLEGGDCGFVKLLCVRAASRWEGRGAAERSGVVVIVQGPRQVLVRQGGL